jgi:membrane protease YdiL (CAAX protease family)
LINDIFAKAFYSAEAAVDRQTKPDKKVMLICVTVAFSVTMIKYLGDQMFVLHFLRNWGCTGLAASFENMISIDPNAALYKLLYWASVVIFFYLVPPLLLIRFVFRESLSEYGLGLKNAFKDNRVYLAMLCIMIPLVLFFSGTESFQARYPFYELQKGEHLYPNLLIWEIFYFIQFFALEFFFRGFMLHGTKKRFGYYSVFVMTIPYCMIHFGKPLPETIAAIIAGIVLGTLSLKSRSIWLGVAIHYSVAITMDVCSLYQKGLL